MIGREDKVGEGIRLAFARFVRLDKRVGCESPFREGDFLLLDCCVFVAVEYKMANFVSYNSSCIRLSKARIFPDSVNYVKRRCRTKNDTGFFREFVEAA